MLDRAFSSILNYKYKSYPGGVANYGVSTAGFCLKVSFCTVLFPKVDSSIFVCKLFESPTLTNTKMWNDVFDYVSLVSPLKQMKQ